MTEKTRLEAAQDAKASAGNEWFRSPLVLLAGLVVFVGVLALVAISLAGGDDDEPEAVATSGDTFLEEGVAPPPDFGGNEVSEIGVVTVAGDPLPLFDPGDPDPALGTSAPIVSTTSLANGADITLGAGRARVVGFFAHWCPHCQREVPELVTWLNENQLPPNTEFIAVSTAVASDRGNYPPSEWFTREGWPTPIVVDDESNTILGAYGFSGFPAFIAIDVNGTVIARAGGNIGADGVAALFANFAS